MQTLYAIRQKSTGYYLPEPTGRAGRGGSHTEPVPESCNNVRLFSSSLSAKRALTSWLQGKFVNVIGYEPEEWGGNVRPYVEGIEIQPQPHRVKEDMEIVSIQLTLVKQHDPKRFAPITR
jgi:hypothetical protein